MEQQNNPTEHNEVEYSSQLTRSVAVEQSEHATGSPSTAASDDHDNHVTEAPQDFSITGETPVHTTRAMSRNQPVLQWLKSIPLHLFEYKLIYIGLIVNILYYVSAAQTHWFHYFFSGSALHMCCRGLDFYQVPNGLWAFTHGGSLDGTLPSGVLPYGNGFPSNYNVYHPLFTILVGGFLTLFNAYDSFYIWMFLKLVATIGIIIYFHRSFKNSKYVHFAIFTMLINSTQYIEITISQFQFVLNFFTFLLLINLARGGEKIPAVIYYFIGLITKPIGILWLPVFFFKKHYTILALGLGFFLFFTLLFYWNQYGAYYTDNLLWHLQTSDTGGPIQIITLAALLKYSTSLPTSVISGLKLFSLLIVVFLCSLKRVSLFKGIFLSTVYFLMFYDLVYEYHYTMLIPILAVCLVMCPEFQRLPARVLILIISLPNAFFILHFFKVGYSYSNPLIPDPDFLGWQIIVLSRIVPILLLACVVILPDVKIVFIRLKRFVLIMRKVNKKLELFG